MFTWSKNDLTVYVLHSTAGLATQILIIQEEPQNSSKFGFLLDAGDGCCRDILETGLNFLNLNGIAFSHGHYDHMGSLHSLLGIQRMLGRKKKFHLFFPKGSSEIISTLNTFKMAYKESIPFDISETPLSINNITFSILDSLEITSYPVIHHGSTFGKFGIGPQIPALGYKIKSIKSNTIIAYSGDTGPTDQLFKLFSNDVDLALVEATYPDDSWISGRNIRFHLTEKESLNYSKSAQEVRIIHKLPQHIKERRTE
ncbi:MAG: MBL fold metallo-hydrolase [Candidatus Hodarchaeales archaeon]